MRCQLKVATGGRRQVFFTAVESVARQKSFVRAWNQAAFTLVEVVMSLAIVVLVFAGIINAYIQSGLRLEWSGYSLAAQSLAIQTIEEARCSVWDPTQSPAVNEITNFMNMAYNPTNQYWSGFTTNILDIPYENTNYVMATNFVSVYSINVSTYSNVQIEVVQVQTVWPFYIRKAHLLFTNTISTIIAPDNRAPNTF
jgi:hypothetical protein